VSSGRLVGTFGPTPYSARAAVLLPCENQVALGTFMGIQIWDKASGRDITPEHYPLDKNKPVVLP